MRNSLFYRKNTTKKEGFFDLLRYREPVNAPQTTRKRPVKVAENLFLDHTGILPCIERVFYVRHGLLRRNIIFRAKCLA